MSKFFRTFRAARPTSTPQRLLSRAAFFGLAIVLLWLAVALLPERPVAEQRTLYSDPAGVIAANPERAARPGRPPLFAPGYFAALAVLGAAAAAAVYLRRSRAGAGGRSELIRSLGVVQVAPGQQLRLVACGEEVLLLGITSGQINLLQRFPKADFDRALQADPASHEMPPAAAPHGLARASFSSLFQNHLGRTPAPEPTEAPC